jgi:3-hydroxy-9,10-secoandrosta-1,3,5(10)-triene-9,17-dione monooxygenase reductase component
MSAIDIARFKEVLGHFPTGVAVVTAETEDGPVGFACQTFASLSLEPLLICFAATTSSTSWPRIQATGSFAVSILSAPQESLARVFGKSGESKFDGVGYTPGRNGAPRLDGALAYIEADIESVTTHGDHDLCVARVTYVENHEGRPLVFYRGGFSCLE